MKPKERLMTLKDISQPAPELYSPGDKVRIYLDPADSDTHTHDTVCKITDVFEDDLDTETGQLTDVYSYRLRDLETDKKLPLAVRHQEFVGLGYPSSALSSI